MLRGSDGLTNLSHARDKFRRKLRLTWYGADPGGDHRFGVAALEESGSFKTWL
jgi:hypothetical protein